MVKANSKNSDFSFKSACNEASSKTHVPKCTLKFFRFSLLRAFLLKRAFKIFLKNLSQENKEAISAAIREAEKVTSAEIVVVVAPVSDAYQSHIVLFGLAVGSFFSSILWAEKLLTAFPYLLMVQLAVISIFSFTPALRSFCISFIPKQILHHRAAHRAFAEYLAVSQKVSYPTPIVVLYVSLAEHYAHILPSRLVREKIPDEIWDSVIREFIATMTKTELHDACISTIQHITKLLTTHFPAGKEVNYISDKVIIADYVK
jgi:putative membrane protein